MQAAQADSPGAAELWHVQRHRRAAPGREGQAEAGIAATLLALLFPGQASQAVGMGTDLRAHSARARSLFALADTVTSQPISRLCAEGPLERLTETDVAQPAVVITSLAALAVLREQLELRPAAVAGH